MSGLVPKLRFKQDDGSDFPEWKEKRLGDLADIIGGGTPETHVDEYWHGSIHWFTPSEITLKYLGNSKRTISPLGLKNSSAKLLPVGTLLLSSRATVGEVGIATQVCATNQGFQSLIVKSTHSNEFIYYWIKQNKNEFLLRSAGSTFLEVGKTEIAKIPVNIPSLPEQQKIADFLSAVDAKIDAVKRKRDAFERYKKGLMQQIFAQKIRFKQEDGTDFPSWEEKRLGDFCKILSGHPVSSENIQEIKNGIPLLRGANISEGFIRHSPEIDRYFEAYTKKLSRFILETGDIVIGMDGSKVGKNIAIIKQNDAGSFLIQRVARLRSDHTNDLRYVYQHLISQRFRQYVDIVNTSSGIPHISLKQISDFEIPMPHSKEQQKIADFLSSVDAKIDAIKAQIEKLEAFKKGLLQQMFV